MGLHDRHYVRDDEPSRLGRPAMYSITAWLIAANIAVFVLQQLTSNFRSIAPMWPKSDMLTYFGHFSTSTVSWNGGLQFWRFLTFQFLHSGFMHIASNLIGLYMFGPDVEQHLGRRKYLAFYLTCGLFGAFAYFLLNALGQLSTRLPFVLINDIHTPLVGASAGVFGVIVACARIAPDSVVQLIFPPVSLKLKYLAYGYVGIAAWVVLFKGDNAGGQAAHLGGAAAGYFFIRHSHLLRDFFDVFSDSRKPSRPKRGSTFKPRLVREDDDELNELLGRVSEVGHANLTQKEKDRLSELTRRRKQADGAA